MNQPLISVIMSTYNETQQELNESVSSILKQTYNNIEFIIIDDAPDNMMLRDFLSSINDERVRIYHNTHNIGLVASLNCALTHISGEYVARMDADDIAFPERLERQLEYMVTNNLDMIGCDVQLIDATGKIIQQRMHFPSNERKILKCIPWGSCLAHPTWLVKTSVYKELNGYRNVHSCEDYDFIVRAIATKRLRLGNAPFIGLQYRLRKEGVSMRNSARQHLLRNYISSNRRNIQNLTENDILTYEKSPKFEREVIKYERFIWTKKHKKSLSVFALFGNKYFYSYMIEKAFLIWRECGE